jgi:hypothetical protein
MEKQCSFCLLTPSITGWGFPDFAENPSDWRMMEGNCDCKCLICEAVKRGGIAFIYRYGIHGKETRMLFREQLIRQNAGTEHNARIPCEIVEAES